MLHLSKAVEAVGRVAPRTVSRKAGLTKKCILSSELLELAHEANAVGFAGCLFVHAA
jgi:hypothetical protein